MWTVEKKIDPILFFQINLICLHIPSYYIVYLSREHYNAIFNLIQFLFRYHFYNLIVLKMLILSHKRDKGTIGSVILKNWKNKLENLNN